METAKLQKVGDSLAVLLNEKMLSLIDANPESTFKISIEDQRVILEMMSSCEMDKHIVKSAKKIMETQRRVFKKLTE